MAGAAWPCPAIKSTQRKCVLRRRRQCVVRRRRTSSNLIRPSTTPESAAQDVFADKDSHICSGAYSLSTAKTEPFGHSGRTGLTVDGHSCLLGCSSIFLYTRSRHKPGQRCPGRRSIVYESGRCSMTACLVDCHGRRLTPFKRARMGIMLKTLTSLEAMMSAGGDRFNARHQDLPQRPPYTM